MTSRTFKSRDKAEWIFEYLLGQGHSLWMVSKTVHIDGCDKKHLFEEADKLYYKTMRTEAAPINW